jgi:hypothetical protein
MEYRLNKIDTDLRQKINDAAKEGFVHGTKNIEINKDKQQEKENNKDSKADAHNKEKKIIINTIKADNVQVEVFKENFNKDELSKGVHLDIKR